MDLFDGEALQLFKPRARNASPQWSAPEYDPELWFRSDRHAGMFFRPVDYPLLFSIGVLVDQQGLITPKSLSAGLQESAFRRVGTITHRGRICEIVETVPEGTGNRYRFYVDQEQQSPIVYYFRYLSDREVERCEVFYDAVRGSWYPRKWEHSTLGADGRLLSLQTVDVVAFDVDADLREVDFRVKPSEGMIVYREEKDQRFVVQDGDEVPLSRHIIARERGKGR